MGSFCNLIIQLKQNKVKERGRDLEKSSKSLFFVLFPVENGVCVVDGLDFHNLVGAAGLAIQRPEELVGGGDFSP